MSRIGKKSVYLPAGVTFAVNNENVVTVKGPKGEISRAFLSDAKFEQATAEDGRVYVDVTVSDPVMQSALWGTMRAHLANLVAGVSEGWSRALELNGVGYKMNVQGKKVVMALGFSHEVIYNLPETITATIEGNVMTISGVDKDMVGKVAAEIRALKKPEPYKGKGFRYTDEIIRRKAGKAAKSD